MKTQEMLSEEEFSDPIPKVEGVVLRGLTGLTNITIDNVITVRDASITVNRNDTVNDNNATGWAGWTNRSIRKDSPITTQEMLPEEEFSDPIPKVEGVVLGTLNNWSNNTLNNDSPHITTSAGTSDFYNHHHRITGITGISGGQVPVPEPPESIRDFLNTTIHDMIHSKMGHFIHENTGRRGEPVEDFLVVCRTLFTETLRELAQSGLINIRRSEVNHIREYYTFIFDYSYNLLNYREPYNGQFRCNVM